MTDTTPTFDRTDPKTWPEVMTADHIAALWEFSTVWLRRLVARGRFVPAPFQFKPARWRKDDVLRVIQPSQGPRLARRAS